MTSEKRWDPNVISTNLIITHSFTAWPYTRGTSTDSGPPSGSIYLTLMWLTAGGWQDSLTLRKVYQQSDAETMLHVVLNGAELREKRG